MEETKKLIIAHLEQCDKYLKSYSHLVHNDQIGQVLMAKSEALKALAQLNSVRH
ncbi:hypothetical protein [Paenibacillus periandrae]|uniref:hypothetical protein n=1 Tax=Paenibacillus periandrae TaxID=1761741 RepID=UPI001F093D85|nr:hypothetical protein [Paenibacillus periandrae]